MTDRPARLSGIRSVNSSRLPAQVVTQFVELLRRGDLVAGERLPPERDLADRFGVGRNSIREALRELSMLGLVTSRHGEGTFVGTPDPTILMAPFRSVIELSAPAADSIMEFRLAFEPGVAALAARNLDEDGEKDLAAALATFEAALGDQTRAEHPDTSFHFAVAKSTRNPAIVAVHQALLGLLQTARTHLSQEAYQPDHRAAVGHRELFEAIVSGDENQARDVMHRHLVDVFKDLVRD